MRIAGFSESSKFWTHIALPGSLLGSMPVSVSVQQTWFSSFRVVGGRYARCEVSCDWFSDRLRVLWNVQNCTSLCSKSVVLLVVKTDRVAKQATVIVCWGINGGVFNSRYGWLRLNRRLLDILSVVAVYLVNRSHVVLVLNRFRWCEVEWQFRLSRVDPFGKFVRCGFGRAASQLDLISGKITRWT